MNKQSGFSLVEIMIALLIGLFLLGGILQMFSASQQTYRMQSNLARLQENGRFALDFLSRDIRMAGYCIGSSVGVSGTEGVAGTAPTVPDAPDSITLWADFTQLTGLCGSPVSMEYSIKTPPVTSTLPNPQITLYQNTNPLIEGIENMQILYGVDKDIPHNGADYYVPANLVLAIDWINVVSVRISLLVVTLDNHLTNKKMTYIYNEQSWNSPDYNIRRVFNTTIALRNNLP